MYGLIIAAILFNFIAFTTKKRLTKNQILHIWTFTISAQLIFDVMIEFKFGGYWYFDKEPNWAGLLAHIVLVPPVNMMYLNWYPFRGDLIKRFSYIVIWVVAILLYEVIALLPEPWGYFNYGWWRLWHAALLDPMLLLLMVKFYKLITRFEGELK
ncbi:hypothetical protein DFO70_102206 [Cytobacillus firmus]|uniref:Uncharacterized protein n=2 Tax=Cytobacillus TaxID=2675230 RepID=A0A366K5L4_CYTFI|nr:MULTISPECIES: hypothetical protein [Cytobacillus]RBP95881.1 hypothetical protein DFO70_102206 [Cytobacillus firmus]TDX44794.1 hypothetical protein DFO72_103206 [Cytobacillus oceanisediminis]